MKFKLDEIAIMNSNPNWPDYRLSFGDEITITGIGPIPGKYKSGERHTADYKIIDEYGDQWLCMEHDLRKRRPPEEAAEEEFQEQLRGWLNKERTVQT